MPRTPEGVELNVLKKTIFSGGQFVTLTSKETHILALVMAGTCSMKYLIEQLYWNKSMESPENTIRSHMFHLRKKIRMLHLTIVHTDEGYTLHGP